MSTAVLRVWEEYQHLSPEDRREFFDLLREEPDKPYDFIEPIPMRLPGACDDYDAEDIAEMNLVAKHSAMPSPADLE